jgi:hypothetical protein
MSDYTLLQHPISRDPRQRPKCCICGDPVCLETCQTDEYGQALHEECYVLKLCLKQEWHVLKLSVKADFLNDDGPYAGHRQTGTRFATLAKQPRHRSGSRQYRKARHACDMLIQRAKRVSWRTWPSKLALAAVVTVLLLSCWIAYGHRNPASLLGSSGSQRSILKEKEQVLIPAKVVARKGSRQPVPVSVEEADTPHFSQQVGDSEIEVVHIGDDVTVRYFRAKPTRTASGPSREVSSRSVGEDVTVRYFTPTGRHTTN